MGGRFVESPDIGGVLLVVLLAVVFAVITKMRNTLDDRRSARELDRDRVTRESKIRRNGIDWRERDIANFKVQLKQAEASGDHAKQTWVAAEIKRLTEEKNRITDAEK